MVTVHGLDIGIHADMTVFSGFSALVYNDKRWSLGTSQKWDRHTGELLWPNLNDWFN